ncbi:MAG: FkbM family methyltransferase [Desulfuromonadales bacterium]|nr:FkbM family methyltransferase [Desulfuromonadales bacterium]
MNKLLESIEAYSQSHKQEDFLTLVFGEHRQAATDGAVPVALFGVGAVGRDLCQVLQLHGVQPVCFCDNNPSEIGRHYSGVPVIPFAELKDSCRNHLIVIASSVYESEIRRQLLENGFAAERLIPVSPIGKPALLGLGYYCHCAYYTENPRHALSMDDLKNHQEELTTAYGLLADQKSRDIFIARLSLFTSPMDFSRFSNYISGFSELNEPEREAFPFYVSPEDYGYFNNDIARLEDGEVLIDGGSFNGLSAATFARTCENKGVAYRGIYCFEPDPGNFGLLKNNTARLHDVTCIQKGLWSHATTLTFLSASECDPGAVLEACSDKAPTPGAIRTEVQTIGIDEQFPDGDVTYIKMDVEGAEIEALRGAAGVIERCRPKLAISAYHKHSDLYELPLLIHSLSPDYKLYLRHYGYTLFDLVLFAIPAQ